MSETREDIAMQHSWEDREIDRLRTENATLREAGVGYSQQTVDALTKERDALRELVWQALEDERASISDHGPNWKERAEKATEAQP